MRPPGMSRRAPRGWTSPPFWPRGRAMAEGRIEREFVKAALSLAARPVTTLCIRCKEEQEQKEKSFG